MSRSLRLSEKWFNRALWLVALLFAAFLIGLGGLVVNDLPRVEHGVSQDDFIDKQNADAARALMKSLQADVRNTEDERERAQLALTTANADYRASQETFRNWLATRSVTEQGEQNPEVVKRTQELDKLKAAERRAQQTLEKLNETTLALNQRMSKEQRGLQTLQEAANDKMQGAVRKQELRVFGYRLALLLPLLAAAGWLFVKKRKTSHWPFVWGFIFFALYAFFVELVPYLPHYGGYVRYIVGIVLTGVIGHYAIKALQRYLERQRAQEAAPDVQRREQLDYDLAQARIAKSVCPGCERAYDMKNEANNFCAHCGLCVFNHCGKCNTRKHAFSRYCFSCGTTAAATT
jgi:hypothetical protein